MKSFYMFLPSNVKDYLYSNSISRYITKLSTTMHLSENWEVGLAERLYTRSWYNISKSQPIKLIDDAGTEFEHPDAILNPGHYDSPELLISVINKFSNLLFNQILNIKLESSGSPPKVVYDTTTKRVTLKSGFVDYQGVNASQRVLLYLQLSSFLEKNARI